MKQKQEFKDSVASELRSLRAKYNMTLKQVSEKADIDIMTVNRYEKNSTSMQLDILQKILNVYKTDIAIFFKNVYANMQNEEE